MPLDIQMVGPNRNGNAETQPEADEAPKRARRGFNQRTIDLLDKRIAKLRTELATAVASRDALQAVQDGQG